MYQVKTYNAIAQAGLDQFTKEYQINQTDNADAYLIRSVNLHDQNFPKSLKVIARAGAGFNNIPLLKRVLQSSTPPAVTPTPLRSSSFRCWLPARVIYSPQRPIQLRTVVPIFHCGPNMIKPSSRVLS